MGAASLPAPPALHWNTAAVAEPVRLDYWLDAVCQTYCKVACDPASPREFEGSLTVLQAGGITISRSIASARRVRPLAEKRSLFLITDPAGAWSVGQSDVVHQVRAGDVAIVDGTATWYFDFPRASRLAVIEFPLALASRWLPVLHSTAPHVARREQGWSKVLSVTCAELGRDLQLASTVTPAVLESNLGELLASCLASRAAPVPHAGDLVRRAIALMKQQLQEPELSVALISLQLGTSPRTLHRAFATSNDTAGACLRRLRIERACELLANPRMLHVRVEEVARRSGFASPSHFAREFRAECGTSPLQWRAARHAAVIVERRTAQLVDCDRRIAMAAARVQELRQQLKNASLSGRVLENAGLLLVETEKYLAQLHRIRALYLQQS